MSDRERQKVVIVTGSSRGIGAAICTRFAAAAYHAVVTFRSHEAEAAQVVETIVGAGGSAEAYPLDVRDESSVRALAAHIDRTRGHLDVLVSNAATEIAKPVDEASLDEWHTVLLTKLDGAFLATKHCIPLLCAARNPSIVYITSGSGERPTGDYIAYEIGTAGLIAMTKAQACYLARKYRIRVNAVSPGPVRTPLWDPLPGTSEEMWTAFDESTPVGRIATTEDVSDACLFLAEDRHRFLNGVFLTVDGGRQWR